MKSGQPRLFNKITLTLKKNNTHYGGIIIVSV